MNTQQEYLLKLLKEIDLICKKYNITYYAAGGTTIGALRHKGFIPWDDDADIYMTRDEFSKFREAFKKENPEGRELGCLEDNPNYPGTIPRYIDTTTTNIARFNLLDTCAAGFIIDIFILDPVPSDPELQRKHRNYLNVYADFVMPYYAFSYRNDDDYLNLYEYYLKKEEKEGRYSVIKELEDILFSYPEEDCEFYTLRWATVPHVFPKNMMGNPVCFQYENLQLPLPERWYDYLIMLYGSDWIYLPPFIEDEGHVVVSNTNMSYSNYMSDASLFIDKKEACLAYNLRKLELLKVKTLSSEFTDKQLDAYTKYILYTLHEQLEKEENSLQYFFTHGKYRKILELFSKYIDAQFSKDYIGRMQHALQYRFNNPVIIPLSDEEYFIIIYSLLAVGRLKDAYRLINLLQNEDKVKSNRLIKLFDKVNSIIDVIKEFYFGKPEDAYKMIESFEKEDISEILVLQWMYLSLKEKLDIEDKNILITDVEASLAKFNNDIEIKKVLADILYSVGDIERAQKIYSEVALKSKNGMILQEISKKIDVDTVHKEELDLGCTALNTDEGKRYFEILKDFHKFCIEHEVFYSIDQQTLLYGYCKGRFYRENVSPTVAMTPDNAVKFLKAFNKQSGCKYVLDYPGNNSKHRDHTIYFMDPETTDIRILLNDKSNMKIIIHVLKQKTDSTIHNYYNRFLEIVNYVDKRINLSNGIGTSLERIFCKAVKSINGGKNYEKKLFNRLLNDSLNSNNKNDFFKSKNRLRQRAQYYLKKEWFNEYKTVSLYGFDFLCVGKPEEYLETLYGKYYKNEVAIRPSINNINRIIDPDNALSKLEASLDLDLNKGKAWDDYKESRIYARHVSSKNKIHNQNWNYMLRTDMRFKLWAKYNPIKSSIMEAYKDRNFDLLCDLLVDYDIEARRFIKVNLGLCFDKDILDAYIALLRYNGENEFADKLISKIPDEHYCEIKIN